MPGGVVHELPVDLRTWRLCTLPGGFYHPGTLIYVDPEVTFRQAHIVGVPVSFQSSISGSTYEHLLTMANKLSDELKKANLKPRDLVDVHLFTAHTLHPDAGKKKAAGRKAGASKTAGRKTGLKKAGARKPTRTNKTVAARKTSKRTTAKTRASRS